MAAGPGAIAAGLAAAAAGFLGSIAGPGAIAAILAAAAAAGFLGSMAAGLAGIGAGAVAPAHHTHVMHRACTRTNGAHTHLAYMHACSYNSPCNSPCRCMHEPHADLARGWACSLALAKSQDFSRRSEGIPPAWRSWRAWREAALSASHSTCAPASIKERPKHYAQA